MKYQRVTVRQNQRAVVLRNSDFERVLHPGTHRLFAALDQLEVQMFTIDPPAFEHDLVPYLLASAPEVVAAEFVRVELSATQLGLVSHDGVLVEVLAPSSRRLYWKGLVDVKLEVHDIAASPWLPSALASRLGPAQARQPPVPGLAGLLQVLVPESQVGLLLLDGVLVELLAPAARRLYWTGLVDVAVELLDISASAEVPSGLAKRLSQTQLRQQAVGGLAGVLQVVVPEHGAGLLMVDGRIERVLPCGSYAFWRFNRSVSVDLVDLRLQTAEVGGQEIMTRDKVGIRLNLSATWRCTDVRKALSQLQKPVDLMYLSLQLALRSAVGTRTLDELLEDKTLIDEVVESQVRDKVAAYGLALVSVGVKDIVLPGDMKLLFAQVVEAEKSAQANTIRRREETAATRSLLNTAKVMEGNPIALRMKELETLERVVTHVDKISVFGGLDQVLDGLVKLR
jgi:regulator of protease activity HflC (stomatin/prohibitin superfamily)